jgi:hypothetical protein
MRNDTTHAGEGGAGPKMDSKEFLRSATLRSTGESSGNVGGTGGGEGEVRLARSS